MTNWRQKRDTLKMKDIGDMVNMTWFGEDRWLLSESWFEENTTGKKIVFKV